MNNYNSSPNSITTILTIPKRRKFADMTKISQLPQSKQSQLLQSDETTTPTHSKLLPLQCFRRSPDDVDPAECRNLPISTSTTPDATNRQSNHNFSTTSSNPLSSTPCAIVKPLTIQIPILHPTRFKNKQNSENYHKTLVSYNELL